MSLWLCERGHTTPGSAGAPVCWACGSLNVHRVEMVPIEDASLFALREERDAARRAHLACQVAWEEDRAILAESQRMVAQLHEINAEVMAELEVEKLDRAEAERHEYHQHMSEADMVASNLEDRCRVTEAELEQAFREGHQAGVNNTDREGEQCDDIEVIVAAWRERRAAEKGGAK